MGCMVFVHGDAKYLPQLNGSIVESNVEYGITKPPEQHIVARCCDDAFATAYPWWRLALMSRITSLDLRTRGGGQGAMSDDLYFGADSW